MEGDYVLRFQSPADRPTDRQTGMQTQRDPHWFTETHLIKKCNQLCFHRLICVNCLPSSVQFIWSFDEIGFCLRMSFFDSVMLICLRFHKFVINMGISGDCVTDRLNTHLFCPPPKKRKQKTKTPNQFLFKCCFQHSRHIACVFFLVFIVTRIASYHISFIRIVFHHRSAYTL